MEQTMILSDIYPELDPVVMFPHPITGQTYKMLSSIQLIELANKTLATLIKMDIKQILVSESGAILFAKICAWISHKKKLDLQWYSIKIPRNIEESFLPTLQAFIKLSKDDLLLSHEYERNPSEFSFTVNADHHLLPERYFNSDDLSLADILKSLRSEIKFPERDYFLSLTKSSALAMFLKQPFIFFDEYIDSGKTLFQSLRFFKLFANSPQCKVFSYLIKLHETEINRNICACLYTLDTEHQAYTDGVYPYENRIDLLGYYYISNKDSFQRKSIAEQNSLHTKETSHSNKLLQFIQSLDNHTIHAEVRSQCSIPEISQWITNHHLVRYYLYKLEESNYGKSAYSELLYHLFDMYGPTWSPLPDSYHLCYIDAFCKTDKNINQHIATTFIRRHYRENRYRIMQLVTYLLETRRTHHQHNVLITLENSYEY